MKKPLFLLSFFLITLCLFVLFGVIQATIFSGLGVLFMLLFWLVRRASLSIEAKNEKIRQSREEWEETFETINDAITIHDADFNIVRANKAAEELLGLPFLSLSRKKCYETYHGTGCPPEGCPSCLTLASGQPTISEMFEPHLGKYIEIKALPRINKQGKLFGLIHMVRDISERKKTDKLQAEQAGHARLNSGVITALSEDMPVSWKLQKVCELLVSHLDAAMARVWTLDANENALELKAGAGPDAHAYRLDERIPVGSFGIGRITEEGIPHITHAMIGDPFAPDQELTIQEGITDFAGYPLSVTNRVVGVLEVFSRGPISERSHAALVSLSDRIALGIAKHEMEESLREQQQFTFNLIRHASLATFVLDSAHRIMIWNKACEELTGCRESDMIGTDDQWKPFYPCKRPTVADLVIDGSVDRLSELCEKYSKSALNAQRIRAEQWFHNLGGKDRYIVFEASPIHNRKGEMIAAVETLHDITESKRLEEQLRQSQKIEAIGQLAGGVAHDFNNILSAIIGHSHITLTKLPKDNPLRDNLEQILQASDRATTLTQSLLAFSRRQVIDPRPGDLNDIVMRQQQFLTRLIREDIEIAITCHDGPLSIFADRGRIEQVLMNLVTNARDAMPQGGCITIKTMTICMDALFIESHGYGRTGTYATIMVSDTGEGMDAKTLDRIFEPFFTTKEQGKGTGLGLSMVYGIVKQHDGFIDVYSEPERGTTFKIYLPLCSRAGEIEQDATERFQTKGGSETILVAEDDDMLRSLTSSVLNNYGYTVIEAVNGEDAVSKYRENKEVVQLLILDGIMPKKNGRESLREIREMRPSVRAIFVSGYAEDIVSRDGLIEPGVNFIMKPLSPSSLLQKVREVLDA